MLEAERQAEAAATAAFELQRPTFEKIELPELSGQPMPTIEERARALFKDLPPLPAEPEAAAEPVEEAAPEAPARPERVTPPPRVAPVSEGPAVVHRAPFIPPRVPRPAPGGDQRGQQQQGRGGPRPVFSSSPGAPGSTGAPARPGSRPGGRPDGPNRSGGPSRPGGPPNRSGGPGGPPSRFGPPSAGAPPVRTFGPDAKPAGSGDRKKGKKSRKNYVDQDAVQANILKTLQGMKGGVRGKRRSDEPSYRDLIASRTAEEREREKTRIRVNEFISVSELAEPMKVPATQIVQFAFKELGLMVTVNQRLDFDQIELIASEFGFQAVREDEYAAELTTAPIEDKAEDLTPRPPIVTIMGHVDHGKTSLLDYIRKANVVAGEAGGITQHIGAYHVSLPGGKQITFLDTPGHEAFTAMRARGAQVTDIVVLVVAADDQVMPQTVEAISHARNAGVPMIVAINKIDLPSANVPKVKQDLLQHNVVLEEFGGNILSTQISAKKGTGVEELLEKILLQAELLDLKANAEGPCHGTVLEATLDPGKGPLATVLVQRGTLHLGDNFICGKFSGRVRAMSDERGKPVKEVGPVAAGADPRLRGRARGGRHLPGRGGRQRGARDRPEAPAARARSAEPARRPRRHAGRLQPGPQGGPGHPAQDHHQGRPGRSRGSAGGRAGPAQHRRSAGGRDPPRRRRHHRERRAAGQGVRAPSSSASTSGPTPTRAPRRSGSRWTSAPTASSTRRSRTCGTRSRACSSPRSGKRCSATPKCCSSSR